MPCLLHPGPQVTLGRAGSPGTGPDVWNLGGGGQET